MGGCPAGTRPCSRCTRAHWAVAPERVASPARGAAPGRAARPDHGDRAQHGWCFGREWEIPAKRRINRSRILRAPHLGVLLLHIQDVVLRLKGKLVGVTERAPAAVGQALQATFPIAIEDFVAGLAGDPERPAQLRHGLAGEPQTAISHPSPNTPSQASLPPRKRGKSVTYVSGTFCNLCVGPLTTAKFPVSIVLRV